MASKFGESKIVALMSLPHLDIICDLLFYKHMSTNNLFVYTVKKQIVAKSDVNMHLSLNRLQVRTDQSAFVIQPIFKKIILIQAEFYKYILYVVVIFLLKRLVCFIHKSINLNVIKICKPVEMF